MPPPVTSKQEKVLRNFSDDRVPETEWSPPGPLFFEPELPNRATQPPPHDQRRQPHAAGRPNSRTKQQGPCLSCRHEGHVAKNCPTWKNRCYRCQKEGHTSESCTLPDKREKAVLTIANDNRDLARALATTCPARWPLPGPRAGHYLPCALATTCPARWP